MIKKFICSAVAAIAATTSAQAITWGEPDAGEHSNVGTLLFVQNGVGFFSCTGTMIAPRVMLTAGHCVEGAGEPNNVTYVRFEDDALSGIGNYGSLQGWFDAEWIAAETTVAHPLWDDYAEFPATYDIGVVILSEDVYPADGFATLPPLGFFDSLKGKENAFKAVGYGRQNTLKPFEMNEYAKYKGDVRALETQSAYNGGDHSVKFSNNPGIGGGTCYGDSGGPSFFQDTNVVAAVTSFGIAKNGNCIGNDFNFRTDTEIAHDFIADILAQYGN